MAKQEKLKAAIEELQKKLKEEQKKDREKAKRKYADFGKEVADLFEAKIANMSMIQTAYDKHLKGGDIPTPLSDNPKPE